MLEGKLQLKNHQVSERAKDKRLKLSKLWNDTGIVDCTHNAARIAMLYKLVEREPGKDYVHFGKTLFYWDRQERPFLHCLAQEEELVRRTLVILDDGTLFYNGQFFDHPHKFMESLTGLQHLVHTRTSLIPNQGLDLVLKGNVDADFVFKFPPDYPPLLLEIALANGDFATANQILVNSSVENAELQNGKNRRKIHLLKCAIECAVFSRHNDFLKHLIEKYSILDPLNENFLEPIKAAVISGQRALISELFKSYPKEKLLQVFSFALEIAIETASPELLTWILDNQNENLPIIINEQRSLNFFSLLFRRFGETYFVRIIKRMNREVPWVELLQDLLKFPGHPSVYINRFKIEGGKIENLDSSIKVDLVCKLIEEKNSLDGIRCFLNENASLNDVLENALLQSIDKENTVAILLGLDVKPTKMHFERLLQKSDLGPERMKIFLMLLTSIESIEAAKANLGITSAFGSEALAAVIEKFPALSQDREFLLSLLKDSWKGAQFAAEQLTSDLLRIPQENEPIRKFPVDDRGFLIDKLKAIPNIGIEISMEILIDILAPAGKVDIIKENLLKKVEFIYEFWWRILFAFQIDVKIDRWLPLAEATFPLLEEGKQKRLLYCSFRYFNYAIAYLWMKCCPHLQPHEITDCFALGIPSGDPAVVDLLVELGHLNIHDKLGNSLLHIAVEENACIMIQRLLDKGFHPKIGNVLGVHPYSIALKADRISACRIIAGERCLDDIAKEWFGLDAEKFKQRLIKAFLNSQSLDILHLFAKIRQRLPPDSSLIGIVNHVEQFIKFPGTLIVRYPRPTEQQEVHCGYGLGQPTYEEVQYSWGNACEKLYQDFYREFEVSDHSMLETLMKFAKSRSHLKGYEVWRMGYFNPGIGLVTHFHWRYFIYWQLAITVYKQLLANPEKYKGSLELKDIGYQILFQSPDLNSIPLSKIELKKPFVKGFFRARMVHTFPNEVKKVLPYLSKLFEDIKNYPKDPQSDKIAPELKKMIAYFFWLGSHNTITERGNSQYMLMLHRLLYNLHGYQAGPWSPLYVQPDCIALLLPFDWFYEKYYDNLFDYPPTGILQIR